MSGENKSKPQWDIASLQSDWLFPDKTKNNKYWPGCREKRILCTVDGNVN